MKSMQVSLCCAGRACTGKRVFFADAAVPASYCAATISCNGAGSGPLVQLKVGDYVAVEVMEGTANALRAGALARTSIAEFVHVEGSTAPLLASAYRGWQSQQPDACAAV